MFVNIYTRQAMAASVLHISHNIITNITNQSIHDIVPCNTSLQNNKSMNKIEQEEENRILSHSTIYFKGDVPS